MTPVVHHPTRPQKARAVQAREAIQELRKEHVAGALSVAEKDFIHATKCQTGIVINAVLTPGIIHMIKRISIVLAVVMALIIIGLSVYCVFLNSIIIQNNNKEIIDYAADTLAEIDELKQYGKPVIVVFGADYCPTCVNYRPYIKELNRVYGEDIVIKYVDTVEHVDIRKVFNIELIPSTIFYYDDGNIYLPDDNIKAVPTDEIVEEYRYVSEDFRIIPSSEINSNQNFEYGSDKNGKLAYCKFVGLIEMQELDKIAKALLSYNE